MLLSDIEANGLLDTVDKFHCAVTNDYISDDYIKYRPQDFVKYLEALEAEVARGGMLVFHNGTKYDIPALDKLSRIYRNKPFSVPWYQVIDTLVLARLIFSNVKDTDVGLLRSGKLPGKRFGSHALEAWGYRLGEMKGEYLTLFKEQLEAEGEPYVDGLEWVAFNEIMMDYNVQDVVVTKALFEHLMGQSHYFPTETVDDSELEYQRFWKSALWAVSLEHEAAWVLAKMERNGYPVNVANLQNLYTTLASRRSELLIELVDTFGSWYQPKGGTEMFRHPKTGKPLPKYHKVKYPKTGSVYLKDGKTLAKGETMKDAPYTPVEYVTFNPASRDHIQKKLQQAGWVPTETTPSGAPKVDDEVLENVKLEDPQAQRCVDLIKEYLMIQKRIGQVAEGDNAWLRHVAPDGRIHGSVNPNGAVTGRATHSYPNMAQVPAADKEYGPDCRKSFGAEHNLKGGLPDPWYQVGVDASGLELRCLGHFMAPFDGGSYCDTILNGDIHWKNTVAAGLYADVPRDKHNPEHEAARGNGKTFIYGFLYGAGAAKIGSIVSGTAEDGKRLIKTFLEQTPAIAALREMIQGSLVKSSKWVGGEQKVTWKRRYIKGLDGRRVHVRSPHAALNTILQSAGAIICKAWVVESIRRIEEAGYVHGWCGDFALMAWIHDEMQIAARTKEIADDIIRICQEAMRDVGNKLEFRCLLDTDGTVGGNWLDCH